MAATADVSPARFYGRDLPRPRFFPDPRLNSVRIDPPMPVNGGLLEWASEASWHMGGINLNNGRRFVGRIEGRVEKLRQLAEKAQRQKMREAKELRKGRRVKARKTIEGDWDEEEEKSEEELKQFEDLMELDVGSEDDEGEDEEDAEEEGDEDQSDGAEAFLRKNPRSRSIQNVELSLKLGRAKKLKVSSTPTEGASIDLGQPISLSFPSQGKKTNGVDMTPLAAGVDSFSTPSPMESSGKRSMGSMATPVAGKSEVQLPQGVELSKTGRKRTSSGSTKSSTRAGSRSARKLQPRRLQPNLDAEENGGGSLHDSPGRNNRRSPQAPSKKANHPAEPTSASRVRRRLT